MIIKIAVDFSDTPGARYKEEGPFSGEVFRESMLKPKFIECEETGEKLIIDLDGGYGYPTSFLEEAFGGLAREFGSDYNRVLNVLEFISEDDLSLIDDIVKYIKEAK